MTATKKPIHTDPLGRPLVQGSPRFTAQQAGGDLTGDAPEGALRQPSPPVATPVRDDGSAKTPSPIAPEPEPDGSEDPGANVDDDLAPRPQSRLAQP